MLVSGGKLAGFLRRRTDDRPLDKVAADFLDRQKFLLGLHSGRDHSSPEQMRRRDDMREQNLLRESAAIPWV